MWIACLLCSVVHPKALCIWIWLVEGTKEAVCSPLTSVLLFAVALWCIEKLWLGYPSQTNAQEIPLLCIILNNSPAIHCEAFIPFKTFILNFVPTVCLSTVMGILLWLYCAGRGRGLWTRFWCPKAEPDFTCPVLCCDVLVLQFVSTGIYLRGNKQHVLLFTSDVGKVKSSRKKVERH